MSLSAAHALFERHQQWALAVAGAAFRRIGPPADIDELRQVAQVKTWDCALDFDPSRWTVKPKGDPFQLFAYQHVYGACLMSGYRGAAGRSRNRDGEFVGFVPVEDASHSIAGEQLAVDDAIDGQHRRQLILAILDELPKRERHLIAEHYLGGVQLSTIAESWHTSAASVSRIHASALGMLRNAVARRGLKAGEWL